MLHQFTRFKVLQALLESVPDDPGTCMVWPFYKDGRGYGQMWFDGYRTLVHRLVYKLEFGPIYPGMCVLHHCDNPPCFRPSHLFQGTPLDNKQDCCAKGRQHRPIGVLNVKAKLTEIEVLQIRELRIGGWTLQSLANRFHVSKSTAGYASKGTSWGHIRLKGGENIAVLPL